MTTTDRAHVAMIRWKRDPWFRWSDHFRRIVIGQQVIPHGHRYFSVEAKQRYLSRSYRVCTWTEEGPTDCMTISFAEDVGTYPSMLKARRACREHSHRYSGGPI